MDTLLGGLFAKLLPIVLLAARVLGLGLLARHPLLALLLLLLLLLVRQVVVGALHDWLGNRSRRVVWSERGEGNVGRGGVALERDGVQR